MTVGFTRRAVHGRIILGAALLLAGCGAGRRAAPTAPPASEAPTVGAAVAVARLQRVVAAASPLPTISAAPAATQDGASALADGPLPAPAPSVAAALDPRDALEPVAADAHWGAAGEFASPGAGGAWGAPSSGAQNTATYRPRGPLYVGVATYYGADFQGLPMAAGPLYDMRNPTLTASNSWPLGTRLRITRIAGGPWDSLLSQAERDYYFHRVITVTVEDRGAFTHALDLSAAAFAELGRPAEGVIRVLIESVDGVPPSRQ